MTDTNRLNGPTRGFPFPVNDYRSEAANRTGSKLRLYVEDASGEWWTSEEVPESHYSDDPDQWPILYMFAPSGSCEEPEFEYAGQ